MPRGKFLQFALQKQAGIDRRFQEFALADPFEHHKPRRAHQRIAVKRAALIAVLEAGGFFRRKQRRQRHAAADPFSKRHDVGRDCSVLVMEQLAGAAHAGLDLVEDQQQAIRVGQRPQLPKELIGRGPDAGFALDRLQHHRNRLVRYQPLDGGEIVEPRFAKARHLRFEQRLKRLLARRRHGRERPAMKAALEGDDLIGAILVQRAVFAREFYGAFVGFGAGIGKEHLVETRMIHERFCELQADRVVVSGARRQQQFGLRGKGFGHGRRRVAEAVHRPALDEVEIALAGVVPEVRAFALHEGGRRTRGDLHQSVERMGSDSHIKLLGVFG